jgi:hypothetical protein
MTELMLTLYDEKSGDETDSVKGSIEAPVDDERAVRTLVLLLLDQLLCRECLGDCIQEDVRRDKAPELASVHTCSAECPCQHGGKPTPDFIGGAEF